MSLEANWLGTFTTLWTSEMSKLALSIATIHGLRELLTYWAVEVVTRFVITHLGGAEFRTVFMGKVTFALLTYSFLFIYFALLPLHSIIIYYLRAE